MKTIQLLTKLLTVCLCIMSLSVLGQSMPEYTLASTFPLLESERTLEKPYVSNEEDIYSTHTLNAQATIKEYLSTHLAYSEQLYIHRVEGRVILVLTIDTSGEVSSKAVHKSLSTDADAVALEALNGLILSEGPYMGASTIFIPVDFRLY